MKHIVYISLIIILLSFIVFDWGRNFANQDTGQSPVYIEKIVYSENFAIDGATLYLADQDLVDRFSSWNQQIVSPSGEQRIFIKQAVASEPEYMMVDSEGNITELTGSNGQKYLDGFSWDTSERYLFFNQHSNPLISDFVIFDTLLIRYFVVPEYRPPM